MLCSLVPCPSCLSQSISTHEGSAACLLVQAVSGCHTYGGTDSHSSSPKCEQKLAIGQQGNDQLLRTGRGEIEQLTGLMRHVTGHGLESKPRPFANALAAGWGSGSCYINAALQLLFSSRRARMKLAEIISTEAGATTEIARSRWHFCTKTDIAAVQTAQQTLPGRLLGDRSLALTFAAAMQGRTDTGASLLGRPLYPSLLLRDCYEGPQEDSALFLMYCLGRCPLTAAHFKGHFHPALLQCAGCGKQTATEAHADERDFTTLQIQGDHPTVQGALVASSIEDLDEEFRGRCPNPACGRRLSHKHQSVAEPPDVLMLQVKIWDYSGTRPTRLVCTMSLDERITVCTKCYWLKGIVYHYGDSPIAGHYVAVTRHGNDPEPFVVYNDAHRQIVPRAQIACSAKLPGSWETCIFHAAVLLYETHEGGPNEYTALSIEWA